MRARKNLGKFSEDQGGSSPRAACHEKTETKDSEEKENTERNALEKDWKEKSKSRHLQCWKVGQGWRNEKKRLLIHS